MTVIYNVEFWSDNVRYDCWAQGNSHHIDAVHFASSLEKAREWCNAHLDYGDGGDDYFPWHFRIIQHEVDMDNCCSTDFSYDYVEKIDPKLLLIDKEEENEFEERLESKSKNKDLPQLFRDIANLMEDYWSND